eukprot:m.239940 g.239940  ORF g.239940 m.239940 type:complete len:972 (+) comp16073_c2_seq1:264-3179(+)
MMRTICREILCIALFYTLGCHAKKDCDEALVFPDKLPTLGKHYIGHYEAVHIDAAHVLSQHNRARRTPLGRPHPFQLEISAFNKTFSIRMENNAHRLFHETFHLEVHGANGTERIKDGFDKSIFYSGHLEGQKHTTGIIGHVDRGVFVAHLHTPEGPYYIERADKYITNPSFSNIIYRGSDASKNMTEALHRAFEGNTYDSMLKRQAEMMVERENDPVLSERLKEQQRRRRNNFNIEEHNTCFVALIADHLFVRNNADGDKFLAASVMTQLLAGATLIYRYTNFGGVGSGISFALKRIIIYTSEESDPFASPSAYQCGLEAGLDASCKETDACAQTVLNSLTESKTLDISDVCLAHAFTHRDFCFGVLGLAWVGTESPAGPGICAVEARDGKHLNTGISTTINFGEKISFQVQTITLAHEFGHNFGSGHDTPNMKEAGQSCTPGSDGQNGGNYIMFYKATDGDEVYNNQFSPCSQAVIGNVVKSRAPSCFTDIEYRICGTAYQVRGNQLCGNGEVGPDEDCDCGSSDPEICKQNDPCCTTNCTLAEGAECSDKKDGLCCTAECKMIGLSLEDTMDVFLNNIDNLEEAYATKFLELNPNEEVPRVCSVADDCRPGRYCVKDPMFKGSCPDSDFVYQPESSEQDVCFDYKCDTNSEDRDCELAKEDIFPCTDGLTNKSLGCYPFHRSTQTECNDGKNYCRVTGCTGSLCSAWPATDVSGKIASQEWAAANPKAVAEKCRLDADPENSGKACHVACRWQLDGPCVSTEDYALTEHGKYINSLGTLSELKLITREPGKSCSFGGDPYGGSCQIVDSNGEKTVACKDAGTDISSELQPKAVARWIENNWQVVVGLVVASIVVIILLKYTYQKKKPVIDRATRKLKNRTIKNKKDAPEGHSAANHPITSRQHNQMRKKLKEKEAVQRLEIFFPGALRDGVDLGKIVRHTENEKAAVKKLLQKGYGFRVPDSVPLLQE